MKIFSLLVIAVLLFSSSFAEIRYVSKNGSSTPPYLSWETASDSIQKCINISGYGDTIYVGNGVYKEKLTMINGLSLIGSGWDSCIINTISIATTSEFNAIDMKNYCLIEGFHIKVKDNQTGAGIYTNRISGDSVFYQGVIRYNKFSLALYGIISRTTFWVITDNLFDNCYEGIYVSSIYTSALCSVHNNYLFDILKYGIGTYLGASAVIYNNFIQIKESFSEGITLFSSGTSQIYNNLVIHKNPISPSSIGIISNNLPSKVLNNFVMNFETGIVSGQGNTIKNNVVLNCFQGIRSDIIIKYNNSWNNEINYYHTPDSTNLSVDPMVVNDSLDYHLQMYSPLIDAGDPDILDINNTRSDIGLYGGPYGEITDYKDLAPKAPKGLSVTADSGMIYLKWKKNTESDFSYYNLYRDTTSGFTADSSTLLFPGLADTFFSQIKPEGMSKLYYKLTATDNQGNQSALSDEVGIVLIGLGNGDYQVVQQYELYQNYPNPFNPSTKIPFRLKERGYVKLSVYDIKGELVALLVNEEREIGYHEIEFTPKGNTSLIPDLASGVYIYQINVKSSNQIPQFSETRKMIYIK